MLCCCGFIKVSLIQRRGHVNPIEIIQQVTKNRNKSSDMYSCQPACTVACCQSLGMFVVEGGAVSLRVWLADGGNMVQFSLLTACLLQGVGWSNPDYIPLMIASTIVGNYDRSQGGGGHMASKLAQVRREHARGLGGRAVGRIQTMEKRWVKSVTLSAPISHLPSRDPPSTTTWCCNGSFTCYKYY